MRIDNEFLSFELPAGWHTEEDDEGNILCSDPGDPGVWLQVELGGVRKPKDALSASAFLAGCYSADLAEGEAALEDLDPQTALVTRSITVDHDGESHVVFYYHLAHNQTIDNVQIVQFGLVCPESRSTTKKISELRTLIEHVARSAVLHPWLADEGT